MADQTLQRARINARQWAELRREVYSVAQTFHHHRRARCAIFAMLRRRFSAPASALRAVDFPAALEAVNDAAKRADAFVDLRYRFEDAALRKAFGAETTNVSEDDLTPAIDELGEPIDESLQQSDVIEDCVDLRNRASNVLQFPARESLSAQIAASPLREIWKAALEKGYVPDADKIREADALFLSMGIEDDS